MKGAVLVLLGLLAGACSRSGLQPPTTTTTVIASAMDARASADVLCSSIATWAVDATHDPGSAIRVIVAGETRDAAGTTFAAEVPKSWTGGDVLAAKSAWHGRLRTSLQEAARCGFVERTGEPSAALDLEDLLVLPRLNSLGERWMFTTGEAAHTAVVCDVSPSAETACGSESLRRGYDRWLKTGIEPSSTFEVWRVGKSISGARRVFAIQTPSGARGDRVAFLLGGRNELASPALLAQHDDEIGSAITETMAVATRSLQDKAGVLTLIVLSDMRQLTPRQIDLEQGTMPTPGRFAEWLTTNGMMLDLSAVNVLVCGLHNRVRPDAEPLPPRRFSELRDLWRTAFASMRPLSITICGACDATAFTE